MAQKKSDLQKTVEDDDRMERIPASQNMKRYTFMLPPGLVERVREHGKIRGKSLAIAIREGMILYAEREGLM